MRKLLILAVLFLAVASPAFRVDNNEPPKVVLGAVDPEVAGDILIPFTLTDREGDTLTILCEYSTDDGATWTAATVKNPTIGLTPDLYAGEAIWDSVADLDGKDAPDTNFRVTPFDNDVGEVGITG